MANELKFAEANEKNLRMEETNVVLLCTSPKPFPLYNP